MRRFNIAWFDKYDWLEYSVEKDATFYFVCYLFKDKTKSLGTHDCFVNEGFRGWNKTKRFDMHVGGLGSAHNQAKEKYDFFIKPKASIIESFSTYTTEAKLLYKSRLTFSLKCLRFLLGQGLACRGNDENEESSNRGNFLELLTWLAENSGDVDKDDRVKARTVMTTFESFEFIFMVHLMLEIFGLTDALCQALQRREQDIVNAMAFVSLTKEQLQNLRDDGWETFFDIVSSLCAKHDIEIPNMNDDYVPRGRSKRFFAKVTNLHRFRVEMFISVIDLQLQELNNRFDEINMELLTCMACLSPVNSFAAFDKQKLLRLAEFYEKDFSDNDFIRLRFELDFFVNDMRKDERFREVKDLSQLSLKLVETNKHASHKLVYLLLKLVLILPVATASVERVFSSMTYVKNKLRNKMGDQLLNDCLITFIEKDIFFQVSGDDVIGRFQNMKTRRVIL